MESGQDTVKRAEFRVGEWVVQPSLNRLVQGGRIQRLRPRLMDLLVLLADHPGRVISKDEIIGKVWGVKFVGDSALARTVAELREALNDDPARPRVIETIPKRGYRMLAPVAHERAESAPSGFRSVAVLPFADLSKAGNQEYFCDGLAEELINSLTRVEGLRVVARTSAFAFKDKSMDVREIARQLSVDAILEGGLQKTGKRLRITVQLIDARNGYHLWSERFDRTLENIFELEDEIARTIADKLRLHLGTGRPPRPLPAFSQEVHGLCLQGRFHYAKENVAAMAAAREYFERALALDAGCAAAWTGLAACLWDSGQFGFTSVPGDLARGREAAARAVDLEPSPAEAHAMLGVYRGAYDFEWAAAQREFATALEAGPPTPAVRERYAMYYLQPMLRLDEAVEQLRLALESDPLSPLLHTQLAHLYILRRENDSALREARHALLLDPAYQGAFAMIGMALAFQGRFDELRGLLEGVRQDSACNDPLTLGGIGWCLALCGQEREARAILAQIQDQNRFGRVSPWSAAWVHVGLGERDAALKWLAQAVAERDPKIVFLRTKPFWDPLRPDPRFQALLRKMRLTD